MKNIFGTFFLSFFVAFATASEDPKVCIDDGCLLGIREESRSGREYFSFLGVPYAKPPLGSLRFEPPEKPDPWDTLEAKKDADTCIFVITNRKENDPPSSEDCLYLNVFTPQIPKNDISGKALPVMVFFHPGGWMFWAGTRDFFGGNYLLDRDVVLVTINFRLNILGFLSTEDEVAPGNWGLKDQTHALRWVRDNIAAFGGDPDSVTIFGDSAGGVSVHYHMMSPLSKGLFHRAIAQSGSAVSPWSVAFPGESREHAEYLGMNFDCPTDNSSVLVRCLRGVPAKELVDADPIFFVWHTDPIIAHKPTIEPDLEGAFLVGHPRDLLEKGQFSDVPFMTGITTAEGDCRTGAFLPHKHIIQNMEVLQIRSFSNMLFYYQHTVDDIRETNAKIKKFYFNDRKVTQKEHAGIRDMISDRYFVVPLVETLDLHITHQKNPIFAYSFEFEAPVTFATYFGLELKKNKKYNGTCHCDDLMYLFPTEKTFHKGYSHNEEGKAMAERMLDLWTNFATHGNPTPEGYGVTWNAVKSSKHEYLAIKGPNDLVMSSTFYPENVAFWKDLNLDRVREFNPHDEL